MLTVTEVLVAVVIAQLSYIIYSWWKDPIRKIPGPTAWPLVGNILMLNPKRLHVQLYEMAKEYGPIMKIHMFNKPVVVVNSVDLCLDALNRQGTDFQGRPPMLRINHILKRDMGFSTTDELFYILRRVSLSGMRNYGAGAAKMENILQEVLQDLIEDINEKAGQTVDTGKLLTGFVCSVMASLMYGERFSSGDPVCLAIHEMNSRIFDAVHPIANSPVLDHFPILFRLRRLLFPEIHKMLEDTITMTDTHVKERFIEAKASYDETQLRGLVDHFIKAQKEELDADSNQMISDTNIIGLIINFTTGAMETSLATFKHAFLDFFHDKPLMRRIQAQIDANFEPVEIITLHDREKLTLLDAYVHENLRLVSQAPLLVSHMTMKDTELGGYQVPANTTVMFNAFNTAHNPDIYPDPFELRIDRFLDEEGKVVPPGHPARHNFIGFGSGRRQCPGELLGRSRIFLLLANILQKFEIEVVGELPERDVRNYDMGILLQSPPIKVKFTLRRCVD